MWPDQPPFDIQIQFDWREQRYVFTGHWHDGVPEESYSVKVPGYSAAIAGLDAAKEESEAAGALERRDPTALLHERRFQVVQGKKEVYRALITEIGQAYRRAQAFESLNDPLDAFVFSGEAGPRDDVPSRIPGSQNSESLADEFIKTSQVEMSLTGGDISYFRLFRARC